MHSRDRRVRARAHRALSVVTAWPFIYVPPRARSRKQIKADSPRRTLSSSCVAGIGERSDATINRGIDNLLYPHCGLSLLPGQDSAQICSECQTKLQRNDAAFILSIDEIRCPARHYVYDPLEKAFHDMFRILSKSKCLYSANTMHHSRSVCLTSHPHRVHR